MGFNSGFKGLIHAVQWRTVYKKKIGSMKVHVFFFTSFFTIIYKNKQKKNIMSLILENTFGGI